ncbi:tRNA-dihydrouridine(20) synthase [NAD(P)+] [Spatholobus suberectus]|nr:tRNA-dihydrouridine(20) synthase [NAD(P)+] [Spatholobus suberectus]
MESGEGKSISDLEGEIFHKLRDFMTGITKMDELGIAGSRLLSDFQQALEFIGRPPIDTNSKLVDKIIVANETRRLKAYLNSGSMKLNESIQSVTNLHSCTHGLHNHISKAKEILNELEGLLGDVTSAIQTTHGNLLPLSDLDFDVELNEQATCNDLEGNDAMSHSQSLAVTTTKKKKNTNGTHLSKLMAFIYSMVRQDYLMQEKIVSALDLKMSSEELESYCQMWSLHPFINDEIVHQAWEHIH